MTISYSPLGYAKGLENAHIEVWGQQRGQRGWWGGGKVQGWNAPCVDSGSGYKHQWSVFDIVLTSRYSKSQTGRTHTMEPLELICGDLVGPMPVESVSCCMYRFVLMEDYSCTNWVLPLRAKSNVWVTKMENGMGRMIKVVMFDNAKGLVARRMKEYCEHKGIRHGCTRWLDLDLAWFLAGLHNSLQFKQMPKKATRERISRIGGSICSIRHPIGHGLVRSARTHCIEIMHVKREGSDREMKHVFHCLWTTSI